MTQRKDVIPLLLALFLLGAVGVLAVVRLQRVPSLWVPWFFNGDMVFAGLYGLWLLLETRISLKDVATAGKTTADLATCQIYACGQALTFLSALWFPSSWPAPGVAHCIGIGVFLAGVSYRTWAIHTLGRFYSHRVRQEAGHRVVDAGPYRFTRHPAYAGMIVAHAGVALFFANPVTTWIFVLGLVPAIVLRIFVEEKMLYGVDGYAEFARKRKRLIPGLW